MKKIISVFVVLILAFSCCMPAFAKITQDAQISKYPCIIVPGYSSAALYMTNDDGSTKGVWGVDVDDALGRVLDHIAEIGIGMGLATVGDARLIADTVGKELVDMLEPLRCNPDGTSVYELKTYEPTAEESCTANLRQKFGDKSGQYETDIMGLVEKYIGSDSLIFNFGTDFRMGPLAAAEELNDYIYDVLDYTGAEKVNIMSISYGGQITGTYLSLYPDAQVVNNVVMCVPALGGAIFAYDALSGKAVLDEENLIFFIEHGMVCETSYDWLVRANQLGFLDDIIDCILPWVYRILEYWQSMWDFIPAEYYEQLKAERLDSQESARLIEISDTMHYKIMPNYGKNFAIARQNGVSITIIAGTGMDSVTGSQVNSDAIISVNSSTGATVAPYGMRFNDNYVQISGSKAEYVSPSMEIDASTCYLPENTFFVDGLYHGMTYWDDYTKELMMYALLTDKVTDVYAMRQFSRFHATTNASQGIFARFNKSDEGYIGPQDSSLIITNISDQNKVQLLSVVVDGMDIEFDVPDTLFAPDTTIVLPFTGSIPENGRTRAAVTIVFSRIGCATPVSTRTLDFTVKNGQSTGYDAENPFVPVDFTNGINDYLTDGTVNVLEKTGFYDLWAMIFNIFKGIFAKLTAVFGG